MLDNPRTPNGTFAAMHNDGFSMTLNPARTAVHAPVVVVVSIERPVQAA